MKLNYPGRLEGIKSVHYNIRIIASKNSDKIKFDSVQLCNHKEDVRLFDAYNKEIFEFKSGDTVDLKFAFFGKDLNLSNLDTSSLNLFYQTKNKKKKIVVNKFNVISSPISN